MGKFKTVNELVNSLQPDYPVYCIRLNEIKVVKFFREFSGKILYAVKTNPNEKIIKQLINNGISEFDVASLNEIKLIKKLNLTLSYTSCIQLRVKKVFLQLTLTMVSKVSLWIVKMN